MTASTRTWEGRGDRLSDARMSWISGRAADDLRLGELHLRMLAHLGRQNHRRGWLRLSQKELSETWGCSRSKLNTAINELVEWHYVAKRSQAQTGESFCTYKVRLDDPEDEPGQSANTARGSVPPAEHPPEGGVFPPGNTRVPAGDTPVFPHGNTPHYIPARAPTTPTTTELNQTSHTQPDAVCVRERTLLDELREEGDGSHVVEHLIAPLWGSLTLGGRDAGRLLRDIREVCAEFSDAALAEAASTIKRERTAWPSAAQAHRACQAVQAKHLVTIRPGSTAWAAWIAHWHATGKGVLARHYEGQGYARVQREFPPVAASDGRVAAGQLQGASKEHAA